MYRQPISNQVAAKSLIVIGNTPQVIPTPSGSMSPERATSRGTRPHTAVTSIRESFVPMSRLVKMMNHDRHHPHEVPEVGICILGCSHPRATRAFRLLNFTSVRDDHGGQPTAGRLCIRDSNGFRQDSPLIDVTDRSAHTASPHQLANKWVQGTLIYPQPKLEVICGTSSDVWKAATLCTAFLMTGGPTCDTSPPPMRA